MAGMDQPINRHRAGKIRTMKDWRKLTEQVAAAVGVSIEFNVLFNMYYDSRTGVTFDPVRDNGQAFGLVVHSIGMTVSRCSGYTMVVIRHRAAEILAIEYDNRHGYDVDESARVAICRAVVMRHALETNSPCVG